MSLFLFLSLFLLLLLASPQPSLAAPYSPTVARLLAALTVKEKVGQMTQLDISMVLKDGSKTELDQSKLQLALGTYGVGSLLNSPYSGQDTRGGLTQQQWVQLIEEIQQFAVNQTAQGIPIVFGLDSLHGANYISGATLFPQNVGLAATFNLELARQAGIITARETRAAGVHWVFGPDVENVLSPIWPRVYETFGEDPYVCAMFGAAVTQGLQADGDLASPEATAACLKHFLGYGVPRSGKDRTDAWIPDSYLRQYFVPPFRAGIDAGAATIMINSGTINGVPVHASHDLLTKLLREELGFEGVAVTDWEDIKKLVTYHRLTPSEREATKIAVLAGVDMSMVPSSYSFSDNLYDLVMSGEIPESRLDESVARILTLKEKLGLLDQQNATKFKEPKRVVTGFNEKDREVALAAARESITLTKNNGILPLSWVAPGNKVLVTGPAADSLVNLCGGWTIHWQGMLDDDEVSFGGSVYDGLKKIRTDVNFAHQMGCSFDSCDAQALEAARVEATTSSVVIMVVGEPPYAESPGNINDLFLGLGQQQLYQTMRSTGKAVITVVVAGRPRVLGPLDQSDAVLLAYLPCVEGGQAIAEVLTGAVNPSGKVPFSYPRNTGDIDVYYHKPWGIYSQGSESPFHDPIYPFGFGLSYTSFKYSNLYLSASSVALGSSIDAYVTCTNTGSRYGQEVALFYLKQNYRLNLTPEDRLLKNFQKFGLNSGEQITLKVTFTPEDMSYYFRTGMPILETGTYTVFIADLKTDFTLV